MLLFHDNYCTIAAANLWQVVGNYIFVANGIMPILLELLQYWSCYVNKTNQLRKRITLYYSQIFFFKLALGAFPQRCQIY